MNMKKKSVKTRRLTKCLSLLLSVIMLCAMLPMTALTAHATVYNGDCGADGDNVTWSLDTASGVLTISGTGAIADYDDGSPSYFKHRESIKTISIGDGVTSIGKWAFFDCNELTSVTIPDSVTTIGKHAFDACSKLSDLTIGEGVESIGSYAFFDSDALTGVTIPESVTLIGYRAFDDCENLQWVNVQNPDCAFPDDQKTFHASTHICCPKNSTVEAYAKKYGHSYGHNWGEWETANGKMTSHCTICSQERELLSGECGDQGDNVTWTLDPYSRLLIISGSGAMAEYYYEYPSFYQYKDSIKTVVIEDGVTSIGNFIFYYCDQVTKVTIPGGVKTIGEGAFRECDALADLTIGEGVESIGNYAFFDSDALTGVTIPESVTSIGMGAFYGCDNLQWVSVQNPDCAFPDDQKIFHASTHICCAENSTAEAYAKKSGNAYGHNWGERETVDEPSCTEEGTKRCSCTFCGEIAEEAIPALGHDGEEIDRDDATCTEDGTIYYYCNRCQDYYYEVIPALGHDFGAWTATADGEQHEHTCSRCNLTAREDHNYGDWITTDDPSCTATGEESRTCTDCSHVDTRAISALGHNYDSVVTPPTCTEGGYTTHTCTRCHDSYTDSETDPLGHDYQIKVIKDASAAATGRASVTCSRCEFSTFITLPKLSEEDYDVTDTATCTEAGNIVYTWKDKTYGTYSVSFDDSPALGHHYVETDLPDGRTEHKCSRCGDVYYTGEATVTKLIGDADGDGEITIYDVTRIQRVLASLETDADIVATARDRGRTGSEALSIFDATNIQRYVAHYQDGNDIGKPRV